MIGELTTRFIRNNTKDNLVIRLYSRINANCKSFVKKNEDKFCESVGIFLWFWFLPNFRTHKVGKSTIFSIFCHFFPSVRVRKLAKNHENSHTQIKLMLKILYQTNFYPNNGRYISKVNYFIFGLNFLQLISP